MGKLSRTKGAQWEREFAKRLRAVMPPGVAIRRGLQSRGAKATNAPDVECPIFWPECKVGKNPSTRAALRQAQHDVTDERIPVAVIKFDGDKPFVAMDMEDFLAFVRLSFYTPHLNPAPPEEDHDNALHPTLPEQSHLES